MREAGFEMTFPDETEATFIPFKLGVLTGSREMKIIDHCTAMPLEEFGEVIEDPVQRGRGTILLATIGLSIRAEFPHWSVARILAIVDDLDISELEWIKGDGAEEEQAGPLADKRSETDDSAISASPSDESASSATPTESSAPETTLTTSVPSSEIPA